MADQLLKLRIQPRSCRDAVLWPANAALERFLADRLGVPRNQVHLVRGLSGRHKQVAVEGFSGGELRRLLLADAPGSPP
ncbi:MAG: DUF167 domain-containing protein [Cyanobium sp. ELA507]